MSKIVFKHQPTEPVSISIAGNFTNWEIESMVFNDLEKQWEFEIDNKALDKCPHQDGKIHTFFKFVDSNGTWFTDDNFAKEIDEHGNENNALYLSVAGTASLETPEQQDEIENEDQTEQMIETPVSPNPTPAIPVAENLGDPNVAPSIAQREESPVLINESDLEEQFHETEEQGTKSVVRSSQANSSLDASTNKDPKEYKNFLQSFIFFFRSLFYRWFSVDKRSK
ncbi:LAFA_0C02630g1_1 [Lachancea sp. 'fantastica']|nr:LAFA_0C02630g1_1 [Lachancea sp. 'fantastica']